MDIHITYETLFDLLRKERSLEELQELDPKFWIYVVQYFRDRNEFFTSSSSIEQEKTRLQLQNIKRIVKEIYERREQKVLQLAVNVVKTESNGYVDTKRLLAEEKYLFNQTISLLTGFKQDVLLQIMSGEFPSIEGISLTSDMIASQLEESKSEPKNTSGSSSSYKEEYTHEDTVEQMQTKNDVFEKNKSSPTDVMPEKQNVSSADAVLVKFLVDLPKFLGKQKEIFGPYKEGVIASLPTKIADILIKKGKAQPVMG